jgi:hypothetical protein
METRESTLEGAGSAKGEGKSLVGEARQEATRIAGAAKERVEEKAAQTKDTAAETVGTVAGVLRDAGQRLEQENVGFGHYAESAAEQVERLAGYLRSHDLGDMLRDAETFARRHPELFLGGAVVAGMMAARFLKSAPRRQEALAVPYQVPIAGSSQPGFNPPYPGSTGPGRDSGGGGL